MVKTDDGITCPHRAQLLDAIDEETSGCPDLARDLPQCLHQRRRGHHRESAQGRRLRRARHVSSRSARCRVDVQTLNTDFACGGVLKWLCGGPGVAYPLCASRSRQETRAEASPDGSPTRIPSAFETGSDPVHGSALPLHERHPAHPVPRSRAPRHRQSLPRSALPTSAKNRSAKPLA